MALSTRELMEGIGASERFRDRVHLVRALPFSGQSGHLYFSALPGAISPAMLARITQQSGNAEVCLMRMDDTRVMYIGVRGFAVANVFVPPRDMGIERFEWLAHTHPLEMSNDHARVSEGPTAEDRIALERIHEIWGQTQSTVVVCRGGQVERLVEFRIERDQRSPYGSDGTLWTPEP